MNDLNNEPGHDLCLIYNMLSQNSWNFGKFILAQIAHLSLLNSQSCAEVLPQDLISSVVITKPVLAVSGKSEGHESMKPPYQLLVFTDQQKQIMLTWFPRSTAGAGTLHYSIVEIYQISEVFSLEQSVVRYIFRTDSMQ